MTINPLSGTAVPNDPYAYDGLGPDFDVTLQ